MIRISRMSSPHLRNSDRRSVSSRITLLRTTAFAPRAILRTRWPFIQIRSRSTEVRGDRGTNESVNVRSDCDIIYWGWRVRGVIPVTKPTVYAESNILQQRSKVAEVNEPQDTPTQERGRGCVKGVGRSELDEVGGDRCCRARTTSTPSPLPVEALVLEGFRVKRSKGSSPRRYISKANRPPISRWRSTFDSTIRMSLSVSSS
jgi:hypothetical protein